VYLFGAEIIKKETAKPDTIEELLWTKHLQLSHLLNSICIAI